MNTGIGFDRIKSRYIIALFFFTWVLIPELLTRFWTDARDTPWYWVDIVYYYPTHFADIGFLVVALALVRPDLRQLFGQAPTQYEWRLLLHTSFLLFSLSSALLFAIYIPLSHPFPQFIQWWLGWVYAPTIYLDHNGSLPVVANSLSWLSMVVLAPVTEELLFRGFLLHRWAARWGVTFAIITSSLLFGVLHPDPLGAALFGVGMCLLYLRTRSLWVPIIAHALNNLLAWSLELNGILEEGLKYYDYGLEEFRGDWGYGIMWAVATLVAGALFLSPKPGKETTALNIDPSKSENLRAGE